MTLLSIIGAAYFWSGRARNARDAAEDIVHVASDVRLAFRRMGFKRKTNIHPVDAIEDNDQLTAIIAKAFVEKKGVVTLDDIVRMREALQNEFDCTDQRAEDLTIVADWAIRECGTVDAALSRASRRHYKTHEMNGFQSLMRVIGQITCETDLVSNFKCNTLCLENEQKGRCHGSQELQTLIRKRTVYDYDRPEGRS